MSTICHEPAGVWPTLEALLPKVSKPARYIGCERNIIRKDPEPGQVRWLLLFPDTYEVGLPNLGLQILYDMLNDAPDAQCERAYLPWPDLAALMREHRVPLFSVDRHDSALAFDIWGVTFPSELLYTNLLEALDLCGLALRAADRGAEAPLVIAGGHGVMNPEPIAPFVDAVVIGDGEDAALEINEVVADWASRAAEDRSKEAVLEELASVPGVYVPSLYEVRYASDGRVASVSPSSPAAPVRVEKRTIADLDALPYPRRPLVPLTEVVHDRLNVEIFRGCTRGCRFCQAGMITRPVRERSPETVKQMIDEGLACSGYDDVSLLSLSSADYSGIEDLVDSVVAEHRSSRLALSLPSLRVDAFTVGLAEKIGSAKKTGLTFAPEAGTWRLRRVINKIISDDDLFGAVGSAYASGWKRMKLYFMVGLPTETDDDVAAIGELGKQVVAIGRDHVRGASCTISVGGFVPKAHTPFQWAAQDTAAELDRKIGILKSATRRTQAKLRWHDADASTAEGIVSRGDRRIADVIEHVWRHGGVFQEWVEHFDLGLWQRALDACDLSLDFYVHRQREADEVFPWDHISAGLRSEFLWDDWSQALQAGVLEDCRWVPCYDCGVCTDYGLEHVTGSTSPPAGGSQGTGQPLPALSPDPVRPVRPVPVQISVAAAPQPSEASAATG